MQGHAFIMVNLSSILERHVQAQNWPKLQRAIAPTEIVLIWDDRLFTRLRNTWSGFLALS